MQWFQGRPDLTYIHESLLQYHGTTKKVWEIPVGECRYIKNRRKTSEINSIKKEPCSGICSDLTHAATGKVEKEVIKAKEIIKGHLRSGMGQMQWGKACVGAYTESEFKPNREKMEKKNLSWQGH